MNGCPAHVPADRITDFDPQTDTIASRDPEEFDHPNEVDFDRPTNRHLASGAGPHRCLGSHLARRELVIAIAEWHKRIPDYEIPAGAHITFHGGTMVGLNSLPLVWQPFITD